MSNEALTFVMKLSVGSSSRKFVMMALANYADEHGIVYPSCAALEAITEMNRKTIINALSELCEAGHLSDTGERKGRTGQVIVYQINGLKSTENGTVPKTEQSQFSLLTVPKTGHEHLRDTTLKKEPKGSKKSDMDSDTNFAIFWSIYPKQRAGSKNKAYVAFIEAMKRFEPGKNRIAAFFAAVERYAASEEVARGYAKGAAAWLNDDRWTNEYKPFQSQQKKPAPARSGVITV